MILIVFAASASSEVYRSGCEYDYPPFCYEDDSGRAAGFSVELLDAALGTMGHQATYETGSWAEVKEWLAEGGVDCLPLVGRTPEREDIFDFTFPYMTQTGAVAVRADCDSVHSAEDLDDLTIGVMAGDNAEEFLLREGYGDSLVTTATFEDALVMLSEGEVDAVVLQRLVGVRLISELDVENVTILDWPLTEFRQDFCFAVGEGDAELLEVLNEGLAIVMVDGTYSYLHAEWFAGMEIPDSRDIIVGGDSDFPPFEFSDSLGNPAGLNVDLMRLAAAEVGLDIDVRLDDWADVREDLETGRIDAITGMFYSPARDLEFDFTQPHTTVHYVPVVAEGEPPDSYDEMSGLSVSVQEEDIAHDYLVQQDHEGGIVPRVSQEEALRALISGESDCALVARLSAVYFQESNGWFLEMGGTPLLSPGYCFSVKQGNDALLAELSEGLRVVMETGAYRRVFEEWMGSYPDEEPVTFSEALRRVMIFVAPLLLLVVLGTLWVRLLRRQVRHRTAELERSRALLDYAQKTAGIGGWDYDVTRDEHHWTSETFRIHGFAPERDLSEMEDPLRMSLACYAPEDRGKLEMAFARSIERGEPYELECEFRSVDGAEKWVRTEGFPVTENGRVTKVRGYIQDITGTKERELRIEHLNHVLRAIRDINQLIVRETAPELLLEKAVSILVEHRSYSAAIIVTVDEAGNVKQWGCAGIRPPEDELDELFSGGELPSCFDRAGEDRLVVVDREAVCSDCALSGYQSENQRVCVLLEHSGVTYGYLLVTLERHVSLDAEEKELLSEMAGDLGYALAAMREREIRIRAETDREELQRQLLQSQKMEAIGQLAGGVAHDFNNMLQVILGHAQMLGEEFSGGHVREDLEGILEAAGRASDLTRQLLLFSRRQVMSMSTLDFNELVENSLKMIRRLIGEHIRLEWLPGSSVGSIEADAGMIEQVLMNLCLNARDAMPSGGVLTIESMSVIIDSTYCAGHAWAVPGRYVLLQVTDTGVGMSRETMERVFEPFFTTKEREKGTGIGLATVYGIVKQHDGMINAYSEEGKGSTFKVYLPVSELKAEEVGVRLDGAVSGGEETILLAEDDDLVRNLAEKILAKAGYSVITVADGEEAVYEFRRGPEVDLLLLDVIMPKMGGDRVTKEIRKTDPGVKVLYTSGYSENAVHTDFVLHDGLSLLQKPYSADELLRSVRRILDS